MVIDVADITLGQWLQQVRGNRKAIALAEEAGMTPQQWSDLETDRSRRKDGSPARPTVETCMKLARVLGQPLETVLFYAGYPTGESLLRSDLLIAESFDVPGPIQNDPNRVMTYESIDLPAYEAFLLGLPPQLQQEEYERIKRLWVEHRRDQTTYGKKADIDE